MPRLRDFDLMVRDAGSRNVGPAFFGIPAGQHGDNNNAIRCEIMSVDKSDEESGREVVIDRERESTCPSCKV